MSLEAFSAIGLGNLLVVACRVAIRERCSGGMLSVADPQSEATPAPIRRRFPV
jgi:hypothetical protein